VPKVPDQQLVPEPRGPGRAAAGQVEPLRSRLALDILLHVDTISSRVPLQTLRVWVRCVRNTHQTHTLPLRFAR